MKGYFREKISKYKQGLCCGNNYEIQIYLFPFYFIVFISLMEYQFYCSCFFILRSMNPK